MIKITTQFLVKCTNQFNRKRGEDEKDYLKRITHLYCANKFLTSISNLTQCENLTVLYLYENSITKIENLEFAKNLTHVYLQNNLIEKLENLSKLTRLQKLYIGRNKIHVVEGLEQLRHLTELHIEYQNVSLGEKLLFDPKTLVSLSNSLTYLNISGNNLDYLSCIKMLTSLKTLIASDNQFSSIIDTCKSVRNIPSLRHINIYGNPICKQQKYKETIITNSHYLISLDGDEISDIARTFLMNWKLAKEARAKQNALRHSKSYHEGVPAIKFPTIYNNTANSSYKNRSNSLTQFNEEFDLGAKFPNIFVPYSIHAAQKITNWTRDQWNKHEKSSTQSL